MEEMQKVSRKISDQFKDIVRLKGFPCRNKVSARVYEAGVVLSLHLPPEDLKFFFKIIDDLSAEEFLPKDKAYFIDRLRLHAGKRQLYGTQVARDEDGKIKVLPIEREEDVDKRRAMVGLPPLKEYLQNFTGGKR